jgi:hypothetical protein
MKGRLIWITGLSGAGKTNAAFANRLLTLLREYFMLIIMLTDMQKLNANHALYAVLLYADSSAMLVLVQNGTWVAIYLLLERNDKGEGKNYPPPPPLHF